MYKDWEKANSKNYEFVKKRTSIKRLYDLLELNYNNGNNKITYNDVDPSFDYTINIPENEEIKAGEYNVTKTIEFDWEDETDSSDTFNVYSFSLRSKSGFSNIENTHKHIPLLVKFFTNYLN